MPSASVTLNRQFLSLANDSLALGDTRTCRQFAQTALDRSRSQADLSGHGRALLVLAQADVLESKLRSAYCLSNISASQLETASDVGGQAEALAVLSYSASALRLDTAADIAERGALLRQSSEDLAQAASLNYLGIASLWMHDFAGADGALEAAAWYANSADHRSASFQPMVNRCFSEAYRVFCQSEGAPVDWTTLFRLLGRAWKLLNDGDLATLSPGTQSIGLLAMLDFSSCFAYARTGNLGKAFLHAMACEANTARLSAHSWVRALAWWARHEVATCRKDSLLARTYAEEVCVAARHGEHAPMVEVGLKLQATTVST